MVKPVVLGIAGGSGSGKSTLARAVADEVSDLDVARLDMDDYYHDQSHRSAHELQHDVNWDHPEAIDTSLLASHLEALRRRESVEVPVYEFSTHARRDWTRRVEPASVVIVDGALLLTDASLRTMCDLTVFVDADADVRLARRIRRDMASRGRSLNSVLDQYLSTVRPMHLQFIEPSKRHADLVVPADDGTRAAAKLLSAELRLRVAAESGVTIEAQS